MEGAGQDWDEHVWALDFPQWQEVTGRLSVADLHKAKERCGIYVLGFANGERYVGQAVDVVRRFTQHCKTHNDITHMTFRRVKKTELNEVERHCIHTLEHQGLKLRNIAHMSVVQGERDLDLVVTPEEQEKWLSGEWDGLKDAEQGVEDDDLRRRYRRRFEQLKQQPHAQDALLLLGMYLQLVVPFPQRTELSFWMVSCLPDYNYEGSRLLFRVSLNMQEVFSLFTHEEGLWASFHLAASPFEEELGENWPEEMVKLGWEISEHGYQPGGHDQFQLYAFGKEEIGELMLMPAPQRAMRLMNLRLMRRGPTYYSKYHSLDLVDAALQAFEEGWEAFFQHLLELQEADNDTEQTLEEGKHP